MTETPCTLGLIKINFFCFTMEVVVLGFGFTVPDFLFLPSHVPALKLDVITCYLYFGIDQKSQPQVFCGTVFSKFGILLWAHFTFYFTIFSHL